MITSASNHNAGALDWSAMATIRSSGLLPQNVPNGIRRPWDVYCYLSGETSQSEILGSSAPRRPRSTNSITFQLSHNFRLAHRPGVIRKTGGSDAV